MPPSATSGVMRSSTLMSGKLAAKTASALGAAHLHRREGVEHEHHDIAFAADAVDDIVAVSAAMAYAVGGDVGGEQRIAAGIHADDRDAGVLGGLQAGRHLGRIDVDDDRVDALVDHVLDAADHGGDVAGGIDDVDVPALLLGDGLEGLDVELGARLGEIGGDDGDLGLRHGGAGRRHGDERGGYESELPRTRCWTERLSMLDRPPDGRGGAWSPCRCAAQRRSAVFLMPRAHYKGAGGRPLRAFGRTAWRRPP